MSRVAGQSRAALEKITDECWLNSFEKMYFHAKVTGKSARFL
jgi:hypothetical protein